MLCFSERYIVNFCSSFNCEWFKKGLELTEINTVNVKESQTLGTSFLAELRRAVDLEAWCTFDEAEFGGEEYLISLSCPFEPFTDEFLTISI